jgi:hypothetical protein
MDEDFEKVNQPTWRFSIRYASRQNWINGKKKSLLMHRVILGLTFGDKRQIDHINGNGLDNRKLNLRVCKNGQNQMNLQVNRKNNTSGFKGISWYKPTQKWVAKIQVNRKHFNLGYFTDKIEAVKRYNLSAKKYFGEFACLNEV